MDVRVLTAGAGVVAALLGALLLAVPPVVIAAGAAGALAVTGVGRGASGLAAASLAVAATAILTVSAVAPADSAVTALVSSLVAAGLAGCLAAALGEVAAVERRPAVDGDGGGTPGGHDDRDDSGGRERASGHAVADLLGAWTALVLPAAAVLALQTASAQPFRSLLGAQLAFQAVALVLLAVPAAVAVGAGWGALAAWRRAGLPPWLCTAGPPVALGGWAVVALPVAPEVDALLAGDLADAPVAYVLLWATAAVLVASALAGAVAADDPRFRRGPAWVAAAVGPLALGAVVAVRGGGTFVGAALATLPPVAGAYGAVLETGTPATATAFLVALSVAGLAFAATLPARAPLLGEVTAGRPAGVGAACLLVAVALAGLGPVGTATAGGLAVLSWALLADEPAVAPPPRTALSRAGVATLAVGGGTVLAVGLVWVAPRAEPGVGGALLLAGVAVLGLAVR